MKQMSPAEISRAIGRMLEAGPDRSNNAEVGRYWQLLTDVSFAMARFAGVSNRQVMSSYRTFDIEFGAGAENLEPYTDTPARLRAEAQALLTDAQAVDQLFPFVLHHAQDHSNMAYLAWAPSEPSLEQAASVLVHECAREDHDLSISGPIALSEITGTDQRIVIGGDSEDARDHELSIEQLKTKYGDEHPRYTAHAYERALEEADVSPALNPYWHWVHGRLGSVHTARAGSTQEFDDTQATREGWTITYGPPPHLQTLDEDQAFKYDVSAWVFVYQQAQGGSEYHQKALEHIQQHNPGEYNAIMAYGAEAVDALRNEPSDEEVAAPIC